MDISVIWNQLLFTASTICIRPNSAATVITSFVPSSNDTNSSSENSPHQENDNEGNEDNEDDQNNANNGEEDDDDEKAQHKKAIQRIRYSKEEYRCTQCPYTCTTEKAFFRHLRWCEAKNSSTLLSCPICGKDRQNEETLAIHMTKHRQDRHFCCDICKFKTLQLKKLIQHRRMHTGEKPHLCPFCSYRSSRRDNLRSHVRRVHKKDDLPCDTFTPRSMVLSPRKS